MKRIVLGLFPVLALLLTMSVHSASAQEPETYDLLIMARNCDSELVEFFTQPQEGCVQAGGAFFNVTSDAGAFLGNCEAEVNETPIFAGCTVEVPYGSTGFVTEDLASLPDGYVPVENPVTFRAVFADGEDYSPIFINELQAGTTPTTELPNTGMGVMDSSGDGLMKVVAVIALSSIAGLLFMVGRRVSPGRSIERVWR